MSAIPSNHSKLSSGSHGICIGSQCGASIQGEYNTVIGYTSEPSLTTGNHQTFMSYDSPSLTTGSHQIMVGYSEPNNSGKRETK